MNHSTSASHYQFPAQARFGRKVAKEKIYQFAQPTHGVKQKFVRQIDKIVWQYKLASNTVNLPESKSIKEIQVFDIWLKGGTETLDETLLRAIDKAIASPIYFRLFKSDLCQCVMAYKRPSEASEQQWVVGDYYASGWFQPESLNSQPLPVVLNMGELYKHLIQSLTPLPPRKEEPLPEQLERLGVIRVKEKELAKLETRLRREKQFNRQVDINRQINQLKAAIQQLSQP